MATKRRLERKHAVRGLLKVHEFTKAGTSLNLEISADGEKIGELEIGRGGLYWWGGHRQKRKRLFARPGPLSRSRSVKISSWYKAGVEGEGSCKSSMCLMPMTRSS